MTARNYVAIGAAVLALDWGHQPERWPLVQPLRERWTVVVPADDTTDTPFVVFLKRTSGTPVYKFECHNGNYGKDSELDFSGDLQCALFALKNGEATGFTLLATATKDESSTDWWNRGRMLSKQLRPGGPCTGYSEYGAIRHFRMRGMLVTLGFTNLEWATPAEQSGAPLKRFTVTLSVTPDETARSANAERARGRSPPTACYPG